MGKMRVKVCIPWVWGMLTEQSSSCGWRCCVVVKTVWYLRYDAALKVDVEEKGFLPKEATSRKASVAV